MTKYSPSACCDTTSSMLGLQAEPSAIQSMHLYQNKKTAGMLGCTDAMAVCLCPCLPTILPGLYARWLPRPLVQLELARCGDLLLSVLLSRPVTPPAWWLVPGHACHLQDPCS